MEMKETTCPNPSFFSILSSSSAFYASNELILVDFALNLLSTKPKEVFSII
jgi:hypothetical protein